MTQQQQRIAAKDLAALDEAIAALRPKILQAKTAPFYKIDPKRALEELIAAAEAVIEVRAAQIERST